MGSKLGFFQAQVSPALILVKMGLFFNYQTSLTASSTWRPDVVLETLGKTESAVRSIFPFDACEEPGINLAESSRLLVLQFITSDFFCRQQRDLKFLRFYQHASKSAYFCRTQGLHPEVFATSFFWQWPDL